MITERMNKVEILILSADIDPVLRYLSSKQCIQFIAEGEREGGESQSDGAMADLQRRLDELGSFFRLEGAVQGEIPLREDREELIREAQALLEAAKPLVEAEKSLSDRKLNLKQMLDEMQAFSKLQISFDQIEHLSYLSVRIGRILDGSLEEVSSRLEKRAVILPLQSPREIIAIATKKGRWALDSELKKFRFEEVKLPKDQSGVPAEIVARIASYLAEVEKQLQDCERKSESFRSAFATKLVCLRDSLRMLMALEQIKASLKLTGSIYRISGWVPHNSVFEMTADLEKITGKKIAVQLFEPEEVPSVKAGKRKVPVRLKNRKLFKSFEGLIFAYGAPLYGTIDPTPFVTVLFVLLFAIMFGDVGQGLVGLLLGILLTRGRVVSWRKWQKFGPIFMVVGIASMFAGLLYGSFFAEENVLVPLTRAATGAILGRPLDRLVTIMPAHGSGKIFAFFAFTLAVGAIINSTGLIINIVNQLRLKRYQQALFGKTGLIGALFFWYALFIAVRVAMGGKVAVLDFICLGLTLLLLFFGEPAYNLLARTRPIFKEGLVTFIMEGLVEILESVSYYFSSSLSFIRVAAFAMVHTVLSVIVFKMGDLLVNAPGGLLLKVLIVILGNILIILLEGLIVTIQVVRLEYYEFFSKFFTEAGERFIPFRLKTPGGL